MTEEFKIAIEDLYKTFSKYPFKSKIEGCPCCVSSTDRATLHSKPLRELEDDDISYYAFKAMTTFGDLEDFKHYLPRIFELAAKRELIVDTFVILGKLEFGEWWNWDEKERKSINNFLLAWWKYDINNRGYIDAELLIELNKLIKDLPKLLSNWNLDIETQGFRSYVDLLESHYYDLISKNKDFKALSKEDILIFKAWISSNSSKLEEGFFRYEAEDKEFAECISNTLYMFERIEK